MIGDLEEVDQHDDEGRRTEAFEGGDRRALRIEEGAHGIGDADAADDQRRQADQRQELREAVDVFGQRGRGRSLVRIDQPAGGKSLFARRRCPRARRRIVQLDLVGMFDEAAGLDQAGGGKRLRG